MDSLFQDYIRIINAVNMQNFRYLHKSIDWNSRLIAISGPRGTGKTTLILQHIKEKFADKSKALYVSLDNIWFTKNSLLNLVNKFYSYGGTHLFLDEVHKYPTWAIEIKNIYDSYPTIHIVFTGSSILKIYKSNADLSRRAINYYLPGLSFREFLLFEQKLNIPSISIQDILDNHVSITEGITSKIKIFPEFKRYLEYGYYPFYKEGIKLYSVRLQNIVNAILENDLTAIENVEYNTVRKIKKLLMIISSLVPYIPNIKKLSGEIESNRANTVRYLDYLQKAGLIKAFLSASKGMGLMNRPDKIYLDNTNLLYALTQSNVNIGNIRETFFASQLSVSHLLNTSQKGDFILNDEHIFEIGGLGKTFKQIKDLPNSYIAMDEIENGHGNKIPLWLFGFTY